MRRRLEKDMQGLFSTHPRPLILIGVVLFLLFLGLLAFMEPSQPSEAQLGGSPSGVRP